MRPGMMLADAEARATARPLRDVLGDLGTPGFGCVGRVGLAVTLGQPKDYIVIQPAGGSAQMPSVPLGEIVPSPIVAGVQLAEMLPGRLKSITSKVIVGGDGAVALDISPKGRILLGTVNELRAKLISVLTYMDACPGVQFELMDARAADSLTVTPPSCLKSPLTQKVP